MKIAVIGAGSTYTPELVSGLGHFRKSLDVDSLVLFDPDPERLRVVGAFAGRMLAHQGLDIDLTLTGDRSAAVTDADAVLIQLRVGGQAARLKDETFPLECGCVGQETTGAGGAAKALRTVPVVLEIADEARTKARPGAWIVDFTNPVGIVTRALLDAGHRAIGLCNFAIGQQRWAARVLQAAPERVQVDPVGLNHFSWIRRILLDGVDVLPTLLRDRMAEVTRQTPFPAQLITDLQAIPSYYLHYYYDHDGVVEQLRHETPRATVVAGVERDLLAKYADPALVERPPELELRGGAYYSEAAVALLASLVTGDGATHVVNVRNNGTIAGLADDDVIEVACRVDHDGATPLPQPPVAEDLAGPIAAVTAYERLLARAAVTGDLSLLRRALLAHPLIGQWSLVEQLVPRLLETSAPYLPRFPATPYPATGHPATGYPATGYLAPTA